MKPTIHHVDDPHLMGWAWFQDKIRKGLVSEDLKPVLACTDRRGKVTRFYYTLKVESTR